MPDTTSPPLAPRPLGARLRAALLPLACAVGLGAWLGGAILPDLARDLAISSTAQPLPGARLAGGRCRSRAMLLHDCTLDLAVRTPQGEVTRSVTHLFASFHSGGFVVRQILAPPGQPERMTSDIGLDRLLNRSVFAAVMASLAVFALVWAASAFRTGRR